MFLLFQNAHVITFLQVLSIDKFISYVKCAPRRRNAASILDCFQLVAELPSQHACAKPRVCSQGRVYFYYSVYSYLYAAKDQRPAA